MIYGTMGYLQTSEGVLILRKGIRENDPNSGYETLPGGKLENDEKGLNNPNGRLESCARETEDETGIKPLELKLRGVILFDNSEREFQNWKNHDNFYVYIYSTTQKQGELKQSDEGIPMYIPSEQLTDLAQNSGDKKMYEWLENGRNFTGVIKHKGRELDIQGTFVDFF